MTVPCVIAKAHRREKKKPLFSSPATLQRLFEQYWTVYYYVISRSTRAAPPSSSSLPTHPLALPTLLAHLLDIAIVVPAYFRNPFFVCLAPLFVSHSSPPDGLPSVFLLRISSFRLALSPCSRRVCWDSPYPSSSSCRAHTTSLPYVPVLIAPTQHAGAPATRSTSLSMRRLRTGGRVHMTASGHHSRASSQEPCPVRPTVTVPLPHRTVTVSTS
ncbi:hypothetical protein C8Q73DRAFT_243269 [Cubamyces lactineus]|nr:hypothetical protein C8Q73DRAFT_243269 [Cubamyces lactineus]